MKSMGMTLANMIKMAASEERKEPKKEKMMEKKNPSKEKKEKAHKTVKGLY